MNFLIKYKLWLLILVAIMLRSLDISYPAFTPDEARITYRGFTLATTGEDELGRRFPLIFNGAEDYQFPLVSYITSLGVLIFGKSDLGVRIPFVLIGVVLIFLTYKNALFLTGDKKFGYLASLLVAFSPPLIFLSKIPNETIVLTTLITFLFYLLTREKMNLFLVGLIVIVAFLTSKFALFLIVPVVFVTLFFYGKSLNLKDRIKVFLLTLIFSLVVTTIFLQIPQSGRSLMENNFTLFTDITIQNGVNRLRGQGIESGWPEISGRIFFNKLSIIPVGFLHWFSNISPSIYFGQIDPSGKLSILGMGAWAKILVVPFLYGLFILIRKEQKRIFPILLYIPLLTFPSFFIFPTLTPSLVVLTLPFMVFIVALGLSKIKKGWMVLFITLMVLEILTNLIYKSTDIKNTNNIRPVWVKEIAVDVYNESKKNEVLLSDDLVSDMAPYIGWYSDYIPSSDSVASGFPYRFTERNPGNIILQGYDEEINLCGTREKRTFFLSPKTLKMMSERIDIKILKPDYLDGLQKPAVYRLPYEVCLE
ncbi:hypothetical protein A3A14_00890 [Candidatus Daviesbacteria bacterium RIFCSPLOWO2_01_FULL_43_38]|uniref:Glycosyltransferase RgtA/B/C/D-like domain-containing protein n=3 Tax=Candidatus Daviesiibacteriota TaxID=1752718 RepID=A0A1F5K692_9BACT|nr:MAG: Glycosyl transferase family 39 [Candidatus Daviesbacteria bacterium GW2011_GWA1_42_6]KKS71232.1 MAG: Glycosyl transferase family 39 [Candidatus Daviesbacteria bacterium GW2011_GWA2_42_7]OGE36476.1 MAG: hypothetical protein A3E45_00970 [Candidatus Daviesbacteria bacterium RIFCSPHIGHO2_12_FULL_43_11]OGE63521.1 MAG: hypothetical protein A3A14_00890 [Candidatus Daviesbacteria bacterium RIFCSPLOWO2_01_FULL_43_38]